MRKSSKTSELRALQERNELLESLSDVGVALAGSFDIRAILETTHDAGRRLAKSVAIDVLYSGCDAINSRPMWYPDAPTDAGLNQSVRDELLARCESGTDDCLDEVELENHRAFSIGYQNERLGYLFVARSEADDANEASVDNAPLLSILTLQAATALRNIHSTQERIHFERLSAIGRMIGSVVHDFRSPLTALRGYAGMLTNLKLDDGERAAYGRYVIEECDRLNHMVNELLEFTRGGTFELEPSFIPARPFLDSIAGRLRAHFGARGIRVELDVDGSETIYVDKDRMDRAIWNVASNACQAMPDGGTVRIRVRAHPSSFAVSIEDEGTGIPEEVRHRIFEPFFSYGKSEGIGLGMLIAKKAAEDHGGTISVESEVGVGTKIHFELPTPDASESSPVEATTSNASR